MHRRKFVNKIKFLVLVFKFCFYLLCNVSDAIPLQKQPGRQISGLNY